MPDTEEKEERRRANERFDREEMGALLRLFSALGITVAAGIVGFFALGLYVDRKLSAWGFETHGVPRIALILFGVALTVYWAYLRIAGHLDRFGGKRKE